MKAIEAFARGGLWDKYEHYFEIYDRFLQPFQGHLVRMLELGVDRGGSIQAWQEYFGPDRLEYFGLDINPECKRFEKAGVKIYIGDQGSRTSLEELSTDLPPLNLVVDDGGHFADQQATSFEVLFRKLAPGGIYIVEDTHTSFWSEYRTELTVNGRTAEMGAIDYFCEMTRLMMERWWHPSSRRAFNLPREKRAPVPAGEYAQSLFSISFFDSLVVLEKRCVPEPLRIRPK